MKRNGGEAGKHVKRRAALPRRRYRPSGTSSTLRLRLFLYQPTCDSLLNVNPQPSSRFPVLNSPSIYLDELRHDSDL